MTNSISVSNWHRNKISILARCSFALASCGFCSQSTKATDLADDVAAEFHQDVLPVLEEYCIRCHGPKKSKARLRLDKLDIDLVNGVDAETWHDVLDMLNLGDMPPEEERQPERQERQAVVKWVTKAIDRAIEVKRSTGGQVVLRRLSRYEYNNTLRDLLGLDLEFANDLPPESTSPEGFMNNGAALGMSPLQFEYYLKSARYALSKAIVTGPPPQVFKHYTEENAKGKELHVTLSDRIGDEAKFLARVMEYPSEGEVRVRVRASAIVPEGEGFPRMRVTLGTRTDKHFQDRAIGEADVTASPDTPQTFEFRGRIDEFPLPGERAKYEGLRVTVHNIYNDDESLSSVEKVLKRKRQKKENPDAPAPIEPLIAIDSLEFEGPIYENWPPATHTRILFPSDQEEDESVYARKVIGRFMERAYRRPVTNDDIDPVVSYFNEIRPDTASSEDAMRDALAMVLISPDFLYLVELKEDASGRQSLTDFELATRLSYFLWSSMPDEALLQLASEGRLREPATLEKKVRAMLADSRSRAFVENFTDQWLGLSSIDRVAVNPEYYPDFDIRLKSDMLQETQRFMAELLYEDLSCLNLIDSDFAMLNRRLAKHYGIPGPKGTEFERVSLRSEYRRGGVLTHGSVLLGNSTGEDSHPIRRAVWLLDRLLDDPPPPPPPDVPALNSADAKFEGLSTKEQLELHRNKESCYDCHEGIDPWGIALENFDAVGQWRDRILSIGKEGASSESPVESSATLPNGHEIGGIEDLKSYLLENERKRFAEALTAKLLSYSLGRSLELGDNATVESLAEDFTKRDYRLSELVIAIARSEPFQTK